MAISKRNTLHVLEYGYMVLTLLLISDALTPLLYRGGDTTNVDDSNPLRLALAVVLYGISAIMLMQHAKSAVSVMRRRPVLVLLIAWTLLSIFWCDAPIPVFRRAMAHLLTMVFCLFVATRYSRSEFFERLLVALFIGAVGSFCLCLAIPSLGVHHGTLEGAWHGVYPHKAIAGRAATLGILLAVLVRPTSDLTRLLRWPTLGFCGILLIMSQSRAAWLGTIACLGFYMALKLYLIAKIEIRLRIFLGISAVVLGIVTAAGTFAAVLSYLGRDMTFSGRTTLWFAAIQIAQKGNTWIGVGYRNFWLGNSIDAILPYISFWSKTPGHGHNGYLDVWLELGWIGSGLLFLFIIGTLSALIKQMSRDPQDVKWAFLLLVFLQFVAANAGAGVALEHTDLLWCAAVLGALYTAHAEYVIALTAKAGTAIIDVGRRTLRPRTTPSPI